MSDVHSGLIWSHRSQLRGSVSQRNCHFQQRQCGPEVIVVLSPSLWIFRSLGSRRCNDWKHVRQSLAEEGTFFAFWARFATHSENKSKRVKQLEIKCRACDWLMGRRNCDEAHVQPRTGLPSVTSQAWAPMWACNHVLDITARPTTYPGDCCCSYCAMHSGCPLISRVAIRR